VRRLAIAALAVAACGKGAGSRAAAGSGAASGSDAASVSDAGSVSDAASVSDAVSGSGSASASEPIPADSTQLLVGVIDDWSSMHATLRLFTRAARGAWQPAGPAWHAIIGKTGAAWGAGLHGAGAPPGHHGPIKHEGDGASPAGAFALGGSYGYAPSATTHLPYQQTDASWQCVDDATSSHYDQVLDRSAIAAPDWKSAEQMRRDDVLYTWVVDVGHNPARTPGAGSCIFLHVWRAPDVPTVGCTAMPEPALLALLATLDPAAHPVFVLLPRAEYAALSPAWHLPAL
jgi:D-alanyl-D-alanine dipeptidase